MSATNYLEQFEFATAPKPNLIKELPNGSHIYCLALKASVAVPAHTGPGLAYIIMSEGECAFTIEGEEIHLKPGVLFEFDANKVHSLKAITDFKAVVITTFSFAAVEFLPTE